MESNFEFLRSEYPELAELGTALEYSLTPQMEPAYAGAVENMFRQLIWRGHLALAGPYKDPSEVEDFKVTDRKGRPIEANPRAAPESRASLADLVECCREVVPNAWKADIKFVVDWLEGVKERRPIRLHDIDPVLRALHGVATWLMSVRGQRRSDEILNPYIPLVELLVRRCNLLQAANTYLGSRVEAQFGKESGEGCDGGEAPPKSHVEMSDLTVHGGQQRSGSVLMSGGANSISAVPRLETPQREVAGGHALVEVPGLEGPVKLVMRLGAGAMGTVWKGHHERLGLVAVKQLRFNAPERFYREVAALQAAHHPNVIKMHAAGMHPEAGAWIVMEYAGGGALTHLIAQKPGVEEVALRCIRQILAGLAHLHRLGLVHRDIKPDNLLLDSAGNVKVADMGLARPLAHGQTLTMTGVPVGTPWYMSPEQVSGTEEVTGASDVWSAGVVLYELLRGERLFKAPNPLLVAHQVKAQEIRLSEALYGKSPKLIAWLGCCLERQAANRFPDASRALVALEHVTGSV